MSDMTMVERVARALCAADGYSWAEDELYMRQARAAIEAMREPTEEMQKAGLRVNKYENKGGCPGVPHGDPCTDWKDPAAISGYMKQTGVCRVARVTMPADEPWRAMIDAALSEQKP